MRTLTSGVIAALVAIGFAGDGASGQQRFSNPTAGISLVPPPGWTVMSMQEVMQNRSKVRIPDEQLQAGLQSATAPLFVFAKYPEPHPSLNPTVQVVLRPRPASLPASATRLLAGSVETLQRAFPDFRYIDPIRATQVSGMPAAYMKAAYTLRTAAGQSHKVLVRTWLVPRGAFLFLIGMSGAAEGADVADTEFAAALSSIVIEK
jgi:hypothetical protein